MKKLKLINSIITLSLTSVALISSVFGWYAENKEASANGLKVNTKEAVVTGGTLQRYKAVLNKDSDGNVTSYSLGADLNLDSTTVEPFDRLADYDLVIYKLAITIQSTSFKLTLTNNDSSISNVISEVSDETYGTNYLSNVATFKLLTTSDNGSTFTTTNFYDNSANKEIGYISDRFNSTDATTKYNKVTLIDTTVTAGSTQTVYLLFDYSVDNVEKLFSANIGKTFTQVYFIEDLKFDIE